MVRLSSFFGDGDEIGPASHQVSQKQINLACAALFVEISAEKLKRRDSDSLDLLDIMKEKMELDSEVLDTLMERINLNLEPAIGKFPYAEMLEKYSSHAQKCAILTAMWKIIWAHGSISAHHEKLLLHMNQILYLSPSDFAATRDEAKPNSPDIALE